MARTGRALTQTQLSYIGISARSYLTTHPPSYISLVLELAILFLSSEQKNWNSALITAHLV